MGFSTLFAPKVEVSHFLCAQGVGNLPFQKVLGALPGEDGQTWN